MPDNDSTRFVGLIAQEVEPVLPEAVTTNDKGLKLVSYTALIGLMVEGMKSQQAQIENLQWAINNCCGYSFLKTKTSGAHPKDTFIFIKKTLEIDSSKFSLGKTGSSGSTPNPEQTNSSKLYQNNPNPFSQSTLIQYETPLSANGVSIMVFDMQGNLIKMFNNLNKGKSSITINGSELRAGMYLYSLIVEGTEIDTKRMILTL